MTPCGSRHLAAAIVFFTAFAGGPLLAQDAPGEPQDHDADADACAQDSASANAEADTPDTCRSDEQKARDAAYQRVVKERLEREKPPHSSFPKWLHTDAFWMPTALGVSTYGVVGAHVVVANIERIYFYGPPGVMLVLDDSTGRRRVRPGLTWGVSILLFDLHIPGAQRTAQIYFNMAKCWTNGPYADAVNLAGLSLAWKK